MNNSAYIEGGAIKWNNEEPLFFNNSFVNNSATYGSDVASFPTRIILKIYNNSDNIAIPDKNEILWPQSNHEITILNNVSSGNTVQYTLQFILLDTYGKIVNLDIG